ncbi:MAG TPA: HAD family phosphatase [Thermoanaerobaculia bacterium]
MPAETPDPPAHTIPTPLAAAIFDFDETIIDLEPQHAAADVALCHAMGSEYMDLPESYRFSSGTRIVDDVRDMRAFFGWPHSEEELFAIRQRAFDQACAESELHLLPGVEATIRALHARGITLAVTSSAVGAAIDAILRRLQLRELFALIVDGSDVTRGKPDPEPYLITARKLGVSPSQCIVFEDSHVGVVAAKRAGMYVIAVRNPHAKSAQDLSEADVVLTTMEDFGLE